MKKSDGKENGTVGIKNTGQTFDAGNILLNGHPLRTLKFDMTTA